jgi:hypothetical protein
VFPREAGIPRSGWDATSPYLPADSVFTLTLVKPPTSGQLLLLPGSPAVTQGHTTETTDSMPGSYVTVPVMAESGYRTLGVTVNGEEPLAGSTFDLCTIAGSDCAADEIVPEITVGVLTATAGVVTATTDQVGTATFPGRYLPGTYTVVQTAAPAGQSFDPSPHTLLVEAAESLTERNTPVRLTLGEPVTPPVPTPTPPVSTPPVSTPPVRTPPLPTPPTSTPTGEAPVPGTPVRSTPVTSAPPTPSVAWQTITPGKQQTVVLGGFQPFETVHGVLHSTPVDLGTAQADAAGFATFTFTIPAGLEVGAHNVTMTGLTSGATAQADFTVTAAAAQDTSGLAYTGTDVLPLLALGGGLLVAGAGAVTVAARRRSA